MAVIDVYTDTGGPSPLSMYKGGVKDINSLKRQPVKRTYIAPHDFGNGAQHMSPEAYFEGLFFNGIYRSTRVKGGQTVLTIPASKKSHTGCLEEYLYPQGPFLGVKVYPPLGYPGDLFSPTKKERFEYPTGRFDNYKALLENCIKHTLPVTAHASPMGMTIADGHNYILNDREKNHSGAVNLRNPGAKECAGYVDKIATHPVYWRELLRTAGLSTLKLCLAHFGGLDAWIGSGNEKSARKEWVDGVVSLITDFPNVYTDISNYNVRPGDLRTPMDGTSFQSILGRCTEDEKRILNRVYSSSSNYYSLNSAYTGDRPNARMILRKYGYLDDDVKKLAELLKGRIKGNDKLRWRILMGSDWYMSELSSNYPGKYYSVMFELLADLTRQLGEGWDVWQQFSVVNPLLFLGLLKAGTGGKPIEVEERGTGLKYYNLDTTRLETAYGKALEKSQMTRWKKLAHISSEMDYEKLNALYEANLSKLKRARIYTAESVKRNGELAILSIR